MRFIDEKTFLDKMKSAGVVPCGTGGAICYEDIDKTLGFDFTNLTPPDTLTSMFEAAADRSVEYAMAGVMFRILEGLGVFPLYLYAADNEWAGEELDPLVRRGLITSEERELLEKITEEGHGMDVVVVEPGEAAAAVRLVAPQLTALGTTCFAVDEKGKTLTSFSQDDEVSFYTIDKGMHEKALAMARRLENVPFEVVTVEDV